MTPREDAAQVVGDLRRSLERGMVAGVRRAWRERNDPEMVRRETARGVVQAAIGLVLTVAALLVLLAAIVRVVVF